MRGKICCANLAMIALILLMSSQSSSADLETVRQAIREKGAHWVAAESKFARLSLQEKKARLGLIKPLHTGAEQVLSSQAPPAGLPAGMDWTAGGRFGNGISYVTPVRNQGACGSCWAFATAGALESYTLLNVNDSICNTTSCDLSEQVLVSCGVSGHRDAGSCSGGYVSYASDYIRNTGLPLESCYTYAAENGRCSDACATWETATYRVGAWDYVATTAPTVESIKNALHNYGPLATTMDVYQDFHDYYESGVYSYVSGSYEGGHAILIVGYEDNPVYPGGGCFRVKNSWDADWGEDGFFRIAYSELSSVVHFGDWTIAYRITAALRSGDFAPADCDVDGSDMAALIADTSVMDLATFAGNLGESACQ